jgi:non-lysosomal glucosylceramidase
MPDKSHFDNLQPHAAFPLGGIGTGSISLHASGALTEFEIFNRPAKGNKLPYSFFCMHAEWAGLKDTRVLEAAQSPDHDKARGWHPHWVMGLPRFERSRMEDTFPFARIAFQDSGLPFTVTLEAFSPFIPLNEDDSGIPAAAFRYKVRNDSGFPAKVLVAASMPNIYGFHGFDSMENYLPSPGSRNTAMQNSGAAGVFMDGTGMPADTLAYADNSILVPSENAVIRPNWYEGRWWDGITDFWNGFTGGKMEAAAADDRKRGTVGPLGYPIGSAGIEKTLEPCAEAEFLFILSWYVPNRIKGWYPDNNPGQTMKNYYATRFSNSWDAGKYLIDNMERLEGDSRLFADALRNSTLPADVICSVSRNLTVLTGNTCFRDETGTFLAWEGCLENEGSCHGTCTHVWNYAQSAAWLFPRLERSARLNEFLIETETDGKMNFRSQKRFGLPAFDMYAAIDGQLGTIIRAYREYILSGDQEFLRQVYPVALKCLGYAQRTWDINGDGLLEGLQHNTYDIEFTGANPLSGSLYLAALQAAFRMAEAMGDTETAASLENRFTASSRAYDEKCFGGSYYIQLEGADSLPYQAGKGCLSDQLFGQTLAHLCGLGRLLPEVHVRAAALSLFKNNFLTPGRHPQCLQRLYVHGDEQGLLLCTWPDGGMPRFPFVYSDEVWTGIEYQAATLLIYEGYVEEGLAIVSAIRKRYDGTRRNPFSEIECGFHYARSLASYGVLVALSGLTTDAEGNTDFSPRINAEDFRCFYCDGRHFGILRQTIGGHGETVRKIEILR